MKFWRKIQSEIAETDERLRQLNANKELKRAREKARLEFEKEMKIGVENSRNKIKEIPNANLNITTNNLLD